MVFRVNCPRSRSKPKRSFGVLLEPRQHTCIYGSIYHHLSTYLYIYRLMCICIHLPTKCRHLYCIPSVGSCCVLHHPKAPVLGEWSAGVPHTSSACAVPGPARRRRTQGRFKRPKKAVHQRPQRDDFNGTLRCWDRVNLDGFLLGSRDQLLQLVQGIDRN